MVELLKTTQLISQLEQGRQKLKTHEYWESQYLMDDLTDSTHKIVKPSCQYKYKHNRSEWDLTLIQQSELETQCQNLITQVTSSGQILNDLRDLVMTSHNQKLSKINSNDAIIKQLLQTATETRLQQIIQTDQIIAQSALPLSQVWYWYQTNSMYDFYLVEIKTRPKLTPTQSIQNHPKYDRYLPLIIRDNLNQYWLYGLNPIGLRQLSRLKSNNITFQCESLSSQSQTQPQHLPASLLYVTLYEEIARNQLHCRQTQNYIQPKSKPISLNPFDTPIELSISTPTPQNSMFVYAEPQQKIHHEQDVNYQQIKEIGQSVEEISKMSIHLRSLILSQGETLEEIAHNLLLTHEHVETGNREIEKANIYRQRSRALTNKILITLGVATASLATLKIVKSSIS